MLASPRSSVQIPTQGIRERAAAWGALGQGFGTLGAGLAEAEKEEPKKKAPTEASKQEESPKQEDAEQNAETPPPAAAVETPPPTAPDSTQQQRLACEQVQAVGDMAAFSDRLKTVFHETAQAVRDAVNGNASLDWNTAWRQQNSPLLQEALADLPPSERPLGQQMAALYGASESQRARREHELGRIGESRNRWQGCLEQAVAAGDERQADHWLQMGRGVFVSEGEMAQRLEEVTSRCRLSRWEQALQTQPVETLTAWMGGTEELPQREEDRRALQNRAAAVQQQLEQRWSHEFSQQVAAGQEPDAAAVQQARQLGVVQETAAPRRGQETRLLCDLCRRVDEHSGADTAALRLQLSTAPLPLETRQRLLQRLETQSAVPAETRGAVSRALWNMYRAGRFGCPGDAVALKRLARLQEAAPARLTAAPAGTMPTDWLTEIRSREEAWVGFES